VNLRPFARAGKMAGISALGLGIGLALSACGPSTSSAAGAASSGAASSGAASSAAASAAATSSAAAPAAQPTGTGQAATSAPADTTVPTTAAPTTVVPTAASSATLVPMQTAAGGEFLSPSGNISCEVDYHKAGLTEVYCQTGTPPQSVTMSADGKYTTCTGVQCLGNPGIGTPTLAYGTATGVGPFRCESATTGVTCTVGGTGFRIAAAGITPVSG
jgi:hypothetical protein